MSSASSHRGPFQIVQSVGVLILKYTPLVALDADVRHAVPIDARGDRDIVAVMNAIC